MVKLMKQDVREVRVGEVRYKGNRDDGCEEYQSPITGVQPPYLLRGVQPPFSFSFF